MARLVGVCLQSLLKLVNSVIGMAGMAMILYSLWMIRVWYMQGADSVSTPPWFIYTFLGLGISFCLITCSGHIAAETASGHCLSCYMLFVFVLVLFESAITADVFLNSNWEEDFPEDPTGRFDEFKDFVKSNFEICKWIGLLVVAAQVFSIFLAMVLRVVGPDHGRSYDSDDDYVPVRLPLLRDHVQQPSQYVPDPNLNKKPDTWNIKSPKETR
ncbi:Tetraspanin-19 [Acorus calamus]|uniref:Tetraspanin-19 n=1 Tax=Acorus calamus TaxID=4465 RepID=A0AAV9EHQ8_ACOCL|nr:Tetraspanin-19 [Acorus calamus]